MARLAVDKDFLDDYSKLEKTVQAAVKTAIDKFGAHTHAGLYPEKLNRCKDDRIRTIGIDQYWRGVVLAPETGDTYSLLRVMRHDKAIEYAGSRQSEFGLILERNPPATLFPSDCSQGLLFDICPSNGPNSLIYLRHS